MNKETIEERKKDFSLIWSRSRYDAHASQDYVADHMGFSRTRIQNWESGISSPTMEEASLYFRTLSLSPLPYYYRYVYLNSEMISGKDDDAKISALLVKIICSLPYVSKKQIYHILTGDHGSSPSIVLNLFVSHLKVNLRYRHSHASVILQNYDVEKSLGNISESDHDPDTVLLRYSVQNAFRSIMDNINSYSNDDNILRKKYKQITDYSQILRNGRHDAGMTLEHLSGELGISKSTASSWENGKSSPGLFHLFEGFRLFGLDPFPYYYDYVYPNCCNVSREQIHSFTKEIVSVVKDLSSTDKRYLLFILYGNHGSSPTGVINLISAHLQVPMRYRLIHYNMIIQDYEIEAALGNLICLENIGPDIDVLTNSIFRIENSVCNQTRYRNLDKFAKI